MKRKNICRLCGKKLNSSSPNKYFCCRECQLLYGRQVHKKKTASRETAFNKSMQEYYAYCEKNGFITYGKYKAIKTVNALKEERSAKNEQQDKEQ